MLSEKRLGRLRNWDDVIVVIDEEFLRPKIWHLWLYAVCIIFLAPLAALASPIMKLLLLALIIIVVIKMNQAYHMCKKITRLLNEHYEGMENGERENTFLIHDGRLDGLLLHISVTTITIKPKKIGIVEIAQEQNETKIKRKAYSVGNIAHIYRGARSLYVKFANGEMLDIGIISRYRYPATQHYFQIEDLLKKYYPEKFAKR